MARLRLAVTVLAAFALAACTIAVTGAGTLDPAAAPAPTAPRSPTGGPTGTPTAACPNAGTPTRGTAGADLTSVLPASTPRALPVRADRSGPRSLDQLLSDYDEPERPAVRKELEAAGFRDGFERSWAAGTVGTSDRKIEVLVVYRFDTPAGACRYLAASTARGGLRPRAASGVAGSVGRADRSGDTRTAVTQATKGPYMIEADALSHSSPADLWTADLLRAAYLTL